MNSMQSRSAAQLVQRQSERDRILRPQSTVSEPPKPTNTPDRPRPPGGSHTTEAPRLPGPGFPAVPYEQRPSRPAVVTAGQQASGRVGSRDVWSRPGEDLVARSRVSGWS